MDCATEGGYVRSFGRSFSIGGLVGALVFFLASLMPSLIPRPWIFQGLVSGLSIVSGYAVGTFLGWLLRRLGVRTELSDSGRRTAWYVFGGLTLASSIVMMILSTRWQSELRERFGMDDVKPSYFLVVVVALAVGLVFIMVGRGLRVAIQRLARYLDRWLHTTIAHVVSAVVVLVLAVLLINGTIVRFAMDRLDDIYSAIDEGTDEGVSPPSVATRSGSPASLVEWDDLGSQGRTFVARGPTQNDLAELHEQPSEPIRVYAGLDSADSLAGTADLVVDELDRTDAWSRSALVVTTATGTGWVDPAMSDTLELMYGGDTAIATMQYSFLPSWVSFVANQDLPPQAGKILFEAVYERWSELSAGERPKLYVFGESLGSYGGQDAFSGLQDMAERTDGALWMGTPNMARNWQFLTSHRDPGSYEYDPVYEGGRQVRWLTDASDPHDLWELGGGTVRPRPGTPAVEWEKPRVVYVQHPSDAVTWWSPDMIWHEPDWLAEPPGRDVLPVLSWMPFVSFWQSTMDLMIAANVPAGHGHKYWLEYVDAWSAIAEPPGWTSSDREALRDVMIKRAERANIDLDIRSSE